MKKELQALALDVRLLDENDNEIDMRNIEEEERRFPRSIDKDEVIDTADKSVTDDEEEVEELEVSEDADDSDIDISLNDIDEDFDESESL